MLQNNPPRFLFRIETFPKDYGMNLVCTALIAFLFFVLTNPSFLTRGDETASPSDKVKPVLEGNILQELKPRTSADCSAWVQATGFTVIQYNVTLFRHFSSWRICHRIEIPRCRTCVKFSLFQQ
jgi:hypothetical protein